MKKTILLAAALAAGFLTMGGAVRRAFNFLPVFGRFFALPTSAARRGDGKSGKRGGFNFLSAFCAVCFAAIISGSAFADNSCGGGFACIGGKVIGSNKSCEKARKEFDECLRKAQQEAEKQRLKQLKGQGYKECFLEGKSIGLHKDKCPPPPGPNFINSDDRESLHAAAALDDVAKVKRLIDGGANVNAKLRSWTPLHFAAGHLRLDTARILVQAGASWNVKDKYGQTPLDIVKKDDIYGNGGQACGFFRPCQEPLWKEMIKQGGK